MHIVYIVKGYNIMDSKSKYAAQAKYHKEKTVTITIRYPISSREYNAIKYIADDRQQSRASFMRECINEKVKEILRAQGLTLDTCPRVDTAR